MPTTYVDHMLGRNARSVIFIFNQGASQVKIYELANWSYFTVILDYNFLQRKGIVI